MSALAIHHSTIDRPPVIALPRMLGFFFSFRLIIILLSVRAFLLDPQVGVEISIALNLLLLVVIVFFSTGSSALSLRPMLQISCFRWVMVFLGFSLCSLLWTVAASVPAAMAYWLAMAADVFSVVLLLRTGAEDSVVASLMEGYVFGACCIAFV